MGDARRRVVDVAAAELVERHILAGDHADHLGARDEHVPLARDDEDEVGDRRRVDGAAGARPRDDADLRDHTRRPDVAQEDVRVAGQRDHPFLDPRAARVVDADDRDPIAKGELLDLDDLLRRDLAKRTPEHGRVIRVDGDGAPVDLAESRHHAVPGEPPLLHAETVSAICGEDVELHERALVQEHVDPVASGRFSCRAPLVFGFGVGMQRLVAALAVLVDLLLGHRRRRARRSFDTFDGRGRSANRRERFRSPGGHTAYRRRRAGRPREPREVRIRPPAD